VIGIDTTELCSPTGFNSFSRFTVADYRTCSIQYPHTIRGRPFGVGFECWLIP
jgi:hypothetical protein